MNTSIFIVTIVNSLLLTALTCAMFVFNYRNSEHYKKRVKRRDLIVLSARLLEAAKTVSDQHMKGPSATVESDVEVLTSVLRDVEVANAMSPQAAWTIHELHRKLFPADFGNPHVVIPLAAGLSGAALIDGVDLLKRGVSRDDRIAIFDTITQDLLDVRVKVLADIQELSQGV